MHDRGREAVDDVLEREFRILRALNLKKGIFVPSRMMMMMMMRGS